MCRSPFYVPAGWYNYAKLVENRIDFEYGRSKCTSVVNMHQYACESDQLESHVLNLGEGSEFANEGWTNFQILRGSWPFSIS